jgi:nicotinate-nucleotide pyrophosphorylase (carboxylating)
VSAAARTSDVIDLALAEDVGTGDVTTEATIPADARGVAGVVVREPGVVCGLDAALEVFRRLDPDAEMDVRSPDGTAVSDAPATVATVRGGYRALLTGERTALNLLQRLSGIATTTRAYVDAVDGTGAAILDTRKTAPGLRALDKHAVLCGGGRNHRAGLDDAVLIKDNHVAVAGGVVPAVRAMRAHRPDLPVEVEVDTLEQLDEALAERAEMILLDNMTTAQLREAVQRTAGQAWLEASGGITLATARAIAETGVDALSVGALTHSVRALDVALEVSPSQP